FLESVGGRTPRGVDRRRQAEESGRDERDRRQPGQQAEVHLDAPVGQLWSRVRRRDRQDEPRAGNRQRPRHRREQQALDQQPAHDPPLRGADRQADRDLARSIGRSRQQQVRQVGGGDQQDEGGGQQ